MTSTLPTPPSSGLSAVIAAYLEAVDAGQTPDREGIIAQYPHLAAELGRFFANQDQVKEMAWAIRHEPSGRAQAPSEAREAAAEPYQLEGSTTDPARAGADGGQHPFPRAVGDHEILGELRRGGMGVVYKARQRSLNRIVALKMILAGSHADAEARDRFRIEAEAVAQVQHPNIVQIYEVGEHDGLPYFTMEFCPAGSLASHLDGTPATALDAAALVEPLAWAIQACHERRIIHRDLKPSNVLLTSHPSASVGNQPAADAADRSDSRFRPSDYIPRLTDFGLARDLDASSRTASNAIVGTPSYMAPEQAAGRVREVGPAADIYALGALLYELLTGRPPFRGPTPMDTLLQVIADDPVPPSRLVPRTPLDLERICLKCLEKEPRNRYATAAALAEDLARFGRGEPVRARPVGYGVRLLKLGKRKPALTALIGVSSLAALLLAVMGLYFVDRLRTERNSALEARDDADEERTRAERLARTEAEAREAADTTRRLAEERRDRLELMVHIARLSAAQREWRDNNPADAWSLLDECPWHLRGWEHDYLWSRYTAPKSLALAQPIRSVAYSPDGSQLAVTFSSVGLALWDGDTLRFLGGHKLPVNCAVFSPDGKRLASGGGDTRSPTSKGELLVWDLEAPQPVPSRHEQRLPVNSLAFHPDGQQIVLGAGSWERAGEVTVWDTIRRRGLATFTGHRSCVASVDYRPDGRQVVSASADLKTGGPGEVKVWDSTGGEPLQSWTGGGGSGVYCARYGPDGTRLVIGGDNGRLEIWDAVKLQRVLTLTGHGAAVYAACFSPDGRRLVSGGFDKTVRAWDAQQGRPLLLFRGHTEAVAHVAFSPDGRHIASGGGDGALRVWDTQQGHEPRVLGSHNGDVGSVAISADGRRAASTGRDEIKLWDPDSGRELHAFKGPSVGGNSVAISPDGRALVGAGPDRFLRVWDAESARELLSLRESFGVSRTVVSPDGQRVYASGEDGCIRAWGVKQNEVLLTLRGRGQFPCFALSADGKRLVTSGLARVQGEPELTLLVFDVERGQELQALRVGRPEYLTAVAFSPDGKRLVSASRGLHDYLGTMTAWDLETGRELFDLKGHTRWVNSIAFFPDGRRFVSASADQTLRVWDAEQGQEVLVLKGHTNWVNSLALSRDGRRLVSGSTDRTVLSWDADRSATLFLRGHTAPVGGLALHADSQRLVSASKDRTLRIWDSRRGLELLTLKGHQGAVHGVAFSPDGQRLVSGSEDQTLKLWKTDTGQLLLTIPAHRWAVTSVCFSPDGTRVASSADYETARVWDARTGELLVSLDESTDPVASVCFSPDGKRLATGSAMRDPATRNSREVWKWRYVGGEVRVWDAETGRVLRIFRGHRAAVCCVCFSPDGKRLASAGGNWDAATKQFVNDGVRVWDAESGQEIYHLRGHQDRVLCVCFSPDGTRLATCGEDRTIRVWDAQTGHPLSLFRDHRAAIRCVTFSSNGKRLFAGHEDGLVRAWEIDQVRPGPGLAP